MQSNLCSIGVYNLQKGIKREINMNSTTHMLTHAHTCSHMLTHAAFHWQREKLKQISEALSSDPVDVSALRHHAISMGGLIHSHVRRKTWPKLVGVSVFHIDPYKGPPLATHKDRAQVLLDVNRCTRRIPKRELQVLMRCSIGALVTKD